VSSVAVVTHALTAAPGGLPRRTIAVLLFLAVFGLYGLTAGTPVGYEDETAAISEGLVKTGQLRVIPGTPLTDQWITGRGGHYYARAGLSQPILEAPFYWVGEQLDRIAANGGSYRWRKDVLRLYDPAIAALTVLAIFGLLALRGVPERRALGVAGLCAVGTLIWPYSKVGMETTLMATVALSILAAAWAAARPSTCRFALAGLAAAATANCKPYGALLVVGVIPLLAGPLGELPKATRVRALAAFAVPLVVGLAAIGWYNWYRTGSAANFVDAHYWALLATPISAIGLFLSPGKGLLLYSPLVVLGLLTMRALWRVDGGLALAIIVTVGLNTIVIAASPVWADDTWGPRYIVPSAWLLVLPIAWWARGRLGIWALSFFALLGVCIQLAGVIPRGDASITAARALAKEPVYAFPHINFHVWDFRHDFLHPPSVPVAPVTYGDDGPRWIPQASPLLFQLELIAAYAKEELTGSGFVVSYRPFRGNATTIDLRRAEYRFALPDFWWMVGPRSNGEELLALLLGALTFGCGVTLLRGRLRPSHARARAAAPLPG